MKKSIAMFLSGMVAGSVTVYTSLFIAVKILNKKLNTEKEYEDDIHEILINRVKATLTGTGSDNLIEKYVDIINNARTMFPNDYNIIVNHINNILDSGEDNQTIFNNIDSYIIALDMIHGAINKENNEKEDTDKSKDILFFEDTPD